MPTQNDVQLNIEVIDQGSKQIKDLIRMMGTLQTSVAATAKSFAAIQKSTTALNTALGKTTSSTQKFEQRLDKLAEEFDDVRRAGGRASQVVVDYAESMDRVAQALNRVRDFGVRQLTAFVQAAGRLEGVTQAFRSILGSAAQATDAVTQLRKAAQDPGLTFEVAAKATQRFLAFGVSLKDSIQITRNFANAAVVSGTSLAELDRGLQQLAKSIGAGKIEQEDLNSIVERFGPIAQNIRAEYGKTGEDVTNAINKAGQSIAQFALQVSSLDKQPKAAVDSLSNAVSNLQNAFNEFSTSIGNTLLPIVKNAISVLTELLKSFNELPESIKGTLTNSALLATAIIGITATVVSAVVAFKALAAIFALGGASSVAGAAGAAAFSIKGLTAALAAQGPFILKSAFLLATAFAGDLLRDTIVKASRDAENAVKNLNNALQEADGVKAYNLALKQMDDQLQRNIGSLKGLQGGLEAAAASIPGLPGVRGLFGLFRRGITGHTDNIITETERQIRSIRSQMVNLEGTNKQVIARLTELVTRAKMQYEQLRLSGKDATDEEVKSVVALIKLLEKELATRNKIEEVVKEAATRPRYTPAPTPSLPSVSAPIAGRRRAQIRAPITGVRESPLIFQQQQLAESARIIGEQWQETSDAIQRRVDAMHQGFRNLFNNVRDTGIQAFQRLKGSALGALAAIQVGSREVFQTLSASANLRRLQFRDEVHLATQRFQAYERWRKARAEGEAAAIRQQREYNRTIQEATYQFRILRAVIQNVFASLNQGTRSGAQGVTGFGTGFIQFTNALINIGETVAQFGGSRLFHNPANDRLAEMAGFRAGSADARQSARDFSNSFGLGFERARRASTPMHSSGEPITIVNQFVVDGRVVKEWSNFVNKMEQSGRVRIR